MRSFVLISKQCGQGSYAKIMLVRVAIKRIFLRTKNEGQGLVLLKPLTLAIPMIREALCFFDSLVVFLIDIAA